MQKEYTISLGSKILIGALATALFISALFLFAQPTPKNPLVYLLPLMFIGLSIVVISIFFKRKIIITENSITVVSLFATNQLNRASIKGYRLAQKIVTIEPLSENAKTITIRNFNTFKDNTEISNWLTENFKDLDADDLETEHQTLLKDTSLGTTPEEREANIKRASLVAKAYNIAGIIGGVSVLIYTAKITFLIALLIPPIGILVLYNFDLIKFISNPKRSVYNQIFIGFLTTCMILLIKSLDYNLLSLQNLWLPAIVVSITIFALIYFKGMNHSAESIMGQILLTITAALIYGFASIRTINCSFDQSQQYTYHATVLHRKISHGKRTSYYLKLSPWGPQQKRENERVSKSFYNNTTIGDTVTVKYEKGYLNIPWFVISEYHRAVN